jgi:hypothetical protein
VLASRLGLIPLKGGKAGLDWIRWFKEGSSLTDYNTVVLHLDVECSWQEKGKELFLKGVTDANKLYVNSNGPLLTFGNSVGAQLTTNAYSISKHVHPGDDRSTS